MGVDADSNGRAGLPEVDLTEGPLRFAFSESALVHSAAVDLHRDSGIAIHLKYLPLRKGFVLNDRIEGRWGKERFVEVERPADKSGLAVILVAGEDGPALRLPGGQVVPLGDRFDLAGKLRAVIPSTILLGDEPRKEPAPPPAEAAAAPKAAQEIAWDALVVSGAGFFLEGWHDDRAAPVSGFVLADRATGEATRFPAYRLRRPDVEEALQPGAPFEFGIWTAGSLPRAGSFEGMTLSLARADGTTRPIELPPARPKPPGDFLDFLLAHFARRTLLGDLTVRSFADLDRGHGALLGRLHREVAASRAIRVEAAFGPRNPGCRLSLVCVLLGIPDFLYLMVSEFARFGPLDGMEFVFVCNSPDMEEVLVRDAELASFVFGARIVLVGLNQNCGFSHANNVGVAAAQGSTIAVINPDVYPRDAAAVSHLLGLAQTGLGNRVAGGKLYYADGSVMHEGMFFTEDRKLSALSAETVWTVEHFRKGFPDTAPMAERPVPAISGALMVLERALYERMEGFDTGFIFGHYEDADLCMRIRQAGGSVVLDPRLAYWHYEGMGSAKRPAQSGSRLYNRWLFTRRWGDRLEAANNV